MNRLKSTLILLLFLIALIPVLPGCDTRPDIVPVPSDAVFYLRADQLSQNWDQLKTRQFVDQALQWRVWREPWMREVTRSIQSLRDDFRHNTGLPLNETTFMQMFGRRVDLCLVPTRNGPAVLLISDLGPKSTPMKKVTRAIESLESERISHFEFMDHSITAVKTRGTTQKGLGIAGGVSEIYYLFNRHRVAIATDREAMEKAILILEGNAEPLMHTDQFQTAETLLGSHSMMLFVDTRDAAAMVRTAAETAAISIPGTRAHADWLALGAQVTATGIDLGSVMKPADIEPDLLILYPDGADDDPGQWAVYSIEQGGFLSDY